MSERTNQPFESNWNAFQTMNGGESLADLASTHPVLLVFLRHFGCAFCREAIDDVARIKPALEEKGVRVAMVHMAAQLDVAEQYFKRFNLFPVDHFSDPDKLLYRAFGLGRTTRVQLVGLMGWIRGFESAVIEGRGAALDREEIGDGLQMPGVFILHRGEILNAFVHRRTHDRPDYMELLRQSGVVS
jgi:peroxiredoxin